MTLPVTLNIATMRAGIHALLILERMFTTLYMAHRTLLHFLCVVAGIVHILMAELALHDSLLVDWFQQANVRMRTMFRS
ncbi:hypothetical protein [Microvirga solisilvae]|uniref:hypothetical protein n=1 Tax=Microvirga solisilvae TaxID=2919498 RepID=UPI001FAE8163|nr:hypothetical protein [Microvirga solisilvae]